MFAFVVFDLVFFSTKPRDWLVITDLFCVGCSVKPELDQPSNAPIA